MGGTRPDQRQVQLASDYDAEWIDAVVESCTPRSLEVKTADGTKVAYALTGRQAPFEAGDDVQLCSDWSLARRKSKHIVILPLAEGQAYPPRLSPALPFEARDWSAAARAGWLYGVMQWACNEDWIDVSFRDLGDDEEFESWAHHGFIQMHEQEADDEEDDDEDEDGAQMAEDLSREVVIAAVDMGAAPVRKSVYDHHQSVRLAMREISSCRTWGDFRALGLTDEELLMSIADVTGYDDLSEPKDSDEFEVNLWEYESFEPSTSLAHAAADFMAELYDEDDSFPVELFEDHDDICFVKDENVEQVVAELRQRGWLVIIDDA